MAWVERLEDEGRITVIRPDHPVEVVRISRDINKMNILSIVLKLSLNCYCKNLGKSVHLQIGEQKKV